MSSQQSNVCDDVIPIAKARERERHSCVQADAKRELSSSRELTFLCAALEHELIVALAHRYWMERGCPEGSAEEDWFRAEHDIRDTTEFGYSVHGYYQTGPVLRLPH